MAAQPDTLRIFLFAMLVAIASGIAIEWPHNRNVRSASLPRDTLSLGERAVDLECGGESCSSAVLAGSNTPPNIKEAKLDGVPFHRPSSSHPPLPPPLGGLPPEPTFHTPSPGSPPSPSSPLTRRREAKLTNLPTHPSRPTPPPTTYIVVPPHPTTPPPRAPTRTRSPTTRLANLPRTVPTVKTRLATRTRTLPITRRFANTETRPTDSSAPLDN
ncbi:hypothetical protein EMCG_06863 [[Emmonsia] crescens]|uniref:Uncharacterized protein n=1 Tax=[Emmonsia] crescens TaxID=73230 RepID=A0A0G2JBH4_9EURO|nr:hypothetical protein EMCG_06863 [Emmonsia crescens UAMH 3008]